MVAVLLFLAAMLGAVSLCSTVLGRLSHALPEAARRPLRPAAAAHGPGQAPRGSQDVLGAVISAAIHCYRNEHE